ncbi:MAG TPA: xanthine dehydrogenase family protein molybdopterin-binding subunit [Casimicrobiaceae bacterium]|nr:xanthine dehydrogenase family protein molybdopterin-binding subunit [Casimicrobiaceae bacterium]
MDVTTSNIHARFGSGKSVLRVEDEALLTGRGRFTDDVTAARAAHMVFVRSPHAHARIVSIDGSAAASMPGVCCVLTGRDLVDAGVKPLPASADFKRADGGPVATPPEHSLAVDAVRHVGEAVAAVVAETRDQARDAAEAIVVDYEPLPAVVEAVDAAAAGAPLVWPAATGNIAAEIRHGDVAATESAFGRAAHVVTLDLVNQRVVPAPMEPRATLAEYDARTDRLTLRVSCQTPTGLRDTLCDMFGIAQDKARVVVGDIGGGFGMKTRLYAEDVCAAFCARKLKRPVKWCADRLEEFLAATHGRDLVSTASLALDANGRVLALRVESLANLGSHATPAGVAIQLMIGPWVSTSVYDIQTIDIHIKGMLTHTTPTGPYRGAGRPEAIYIIERLMDAAARQTGIDPIELRRRNMIRPEQMPYKNPMGRTYDSGQFAKVMDAGVELADWRGFDARAAQSKARGRIRGRGIATFLEWTGVDIFEEKVTVTVDGDGGIEIFSATQAMGTGLATTYAQLVVDVFHVPIERVTISQGDTDRGTGFGSAGSRSIFVGGSAVRVASERTVEKAKGLAATELEAALADLEYSDAAFRIAGTDRSIGLFELARKQPGRRIELVSVSSVDGPTWPNGCHIAEVEINPETGVVDVVAYASVNDVGHVVNPMIVIGQLDGGAVQGIGQALTEHFVFDRSSGQALTASFLDYALPLATHAPPFRTTMDESTPCRNNAMGIKGVGELGTIGATPAVANAVLDALLRAGGGERARVLQMPFTAKRVWETLQAAP